MDLYEIRFLQSLIFTTLIETVFLLLLSRLWLLRHRTSRADTLLLVAVGLIGSALTLPYVWFVFPAFLKSRVLYVPIVELFALSVESIIIWILVKCPFVKAVVLAVLCNAVSFSSGLWLFRSHL